MLTGFLMAITSRLVPRITAMAMMPMTNQAQNCLYQRLSVCGCMLTLCLTDGGADESAVGVIVDACVIRGLDAEEDGVGARRKFFRLDGQLHRNREHFAGGDAHVTLALENQAVDAIGREREGHVLLRLVHDLHGVD